MGTTTNTFKFSQPLVQLMGAGHFIFAGTSILSLVIAFGFFSFLTPLWQNQTLLVAKEVAKNHIKDLDAEIMTQDYHEIQARLNRLEFSILPVKSFIQGQYELVWGGIALFKLSLRRRFCLKKSKEQNAQLFILFQSKVLSKCKKVRKLLKTSRFKSGKIKDDYSLLFKVLSPINGVVQSTKGTGRFITQLRISSNMGSFYFNSVAGCII